jgi:hypothetical protein
MPKKSYRFAVAYNNVLATSNFKISDLSPFENTGADSSGNIEIQKIYEIQNAYNLLPHQNKSVGSFSVNIAFGSAAEVATMANIEAGTKVILLGRQAQGGTGKHDRFFYLNKKYSGNSDITVSITAINGDDSSAPSVTRQGGGSVDLSKPENASGDTLELQHSVDGGTWTTFKNVRPHDAGDGVRDLTFTEFRTVTATFTPPSGQDVYIRVKQQNHAGFGHDHYAIKDFTVNAPFAERSEPKPNNFLDGQMKSGLTTQHPRVAQQINDSMEDRSYVAKDYSLVSRSIVGKSFVDNKFDDTLESQSPSRRRQEMISLRAGVDLIDKVKFYVRGANGLAFKTFAITSGNDSAWNKNGGLNATDVKVNVTSYIDAIPNRVRSDELITLSIARALGDAIQKEKSLKLDVTVKLNSIFLKDKHVESISVASFENFKPPRAIHHPRVKLKMLDGDATLNTGDPVDFAENQSLTLQDATGYSKKYVLVDANATAVTTGTVLAADSDTGSGTAGASNVGGIAVAVNLTGSYSTQNALLVQLRLAILSANGHAGRILVENVPVQANGNQTIDIISALPPLREGSGFSYTDNLGGSQFIVEDSAAYHQKVKRPTCTVTVDHGVAASSLPAELSIVTIVTGDGTSRKYVTVIDASTAVETGDILGVGSDYGSGTLSAGHAAIGGIAVALGTTQHSYIVSLKKAITHSNGHAKKIKVSSYPVIDSGNQVITLTDITSGIYVPEVGATVRSAVETVAVASVTFSDWSKNGVSGGKIVETVFGNDLKNVRVEVINLHGLENPIVHGINHAKNGIGKNSLVGHSTLPDLVSSVEPSPGSGYSTYLPLIRSGSISAFKEEKLHSAFAGSPGSDVVIEKSYVTRKGEGISRYDVVGQGFQSDVSAKECITIEIDGSGEPSLILYPEGNGSATDVRPTTAYLNSTTGKWTALASDRPHDNTFPGGSGTAITGLWNINRQIAERSFVGFGQGQRNMFRLLGAPPSANGSFVQNSFKMSTESFELEKDKYAFIESAHNPCINSFGFPSHPKFAASDSMSFDMSKYIDEDFLVESIAVDVKISTEAPSIYANSNFLNKNASFDSRKNRFGEIRPAGCTFFLLNQRKSFIPEGISQNTFQLEQDVTGSVNIKTSNINRDLYSLPGWYPTGARHPAGWSRGTLPSTVIYNGGVATTVNNDTHADATGWSFKKVDALGTSDADFDVEDSRVQLTNNTFITTSTTENTYHKNANTTRSNSPPYFIPIEEGYDLTSYLTTSEAYRIRLLGRKRWSGLNSKATYLYMMIYVTYLDDLLGNRPSGVRNIVAKIKISEEDAVVDVPLKTIFDGKGRKFNLSIKIKTNGTFADNFLDLRAMEIYRVSSSSYVDTVRDVVGWGPVGVIPTEFDDVVASNFATKAKDPRDSYALVIADDNPATRELTVTFPPRTPSAGEYGTLSSPGAEPRQIITNWDSMGRSGLEGVPSDRSPINATAPGVEAMYISRQYASYWEIPQPKSQGLISPYLLKKTDKLILGAQSLTSYQIPTTNGGVTNVTLNPSKITLKLYGSRITNNKGSYAQTTDNLSSNAVHETIGNDPVRDQFETEPSYMYEGTYLDNIMFGDASLTKELRSGEMIDLGIPRSYTGDIIGDLTSDNFHLGKKTPWGFGRYGDFDPFLPTFQSVASPNASFPASEKFLLIDQNGLAKIYESNSSNLYEDNPGVTSNVTVAGVSAPRVIFYVGANFQEGVRQLAYAINHSNGHNGGGASNDHLIAVESTFDSTVTDKKHVLQIIPRVKSREEADEYDSGAKSLTIAYAPASTSYWSTNKSPRYEHLGGASLKACGIPMVAHAWQWNWHRKTKDFNRGVVARSSYGTAGITGSFQTFVQLKEDSVFKYDSLVIPTYEFLSMFNVVVPANASGPSAHPRAVDGHATNSTSPNITGSFLPIFQRAQIINQRGGLHTGYVNISDGDGVAGSGGNIGFNKNVTNLWSRWPFERGDRRSISALNPTTFRCDVKNASNLKQAIPICRVQVPDMNRTDGSKLNGVNYANRNVVTAISSHYSASLVGFGRLNGSHLYGGSSRDGVSSHAERTPSITSETEWASYSPRENLDIREKTLKALFGFETSHYMRWGTSENDLHKLSNGNEYLDFKSRFKPGYKASGPKSEMKDCGDAVSRAHIVVRGMRYGIDNYIPTEDKVYMRHNKYGQFRDTLEQRKFYVSCDENGERLPDVPVEVKFISRPIFDDLGNISANRKEGVTPSSTNSQNLSTYATASIPYIDDWEKTALGSSVWLYGRDRSSAQPDLKDAVTSIQIT